MAAVLALRGFCRTGPARSLFGGLRVNGIYKNLNILPSTQTTPKALETYQAKSFSVTPQKKAAPEIEQAGHDHVIHWTAERVLSLALIGALPVAIVLPSTTAEYFLALSMTLHSHWGIEAIVVDYIRPSVFGKVIPKLSVAAVYGLSIMTLGGLFYFIYTDVGIINAVKLLWKL